MACVTLNGKGCGSGLKMQTSLFRPSCLGGSRVVLLGKRLRNGAGNRRRLCIAAAAAPGLKDKILSKGKRIVDGNVVREGGETLKSLFFSENAPSWNELEAMVVQKGADLGVEAPDLETGPPNSMANRRTFGSSEPIRVKLHRDTAAWCPYCQKVLMQLEEKRIPYETESIHLNCYGEKDPSYLQMVPSGLVPSMELNREVIEDSTHILEILEHEFPDKPLLPRGTSVKEPANFIEKLQRPCISAWIAWLTSNEEEEEHKASFVAAMQAVDDQLGVTSGPYFLEDFSLVDISFTPMTERMNATVTYYKGFRMRGEGRFPNIDRWFEAMETRPSYIAMRSDYYVHSHSFPNLLGGFIMSEDGKPVAKRIDGDEWRLPLEPLSAHSFEPYAPGDNPPLDTFLAARRLVENHEAVVRFACRGCGEDHQPLEAPLANPNATPNYDYQPQVDAALRHVAHALLVGVEGKQSSQTGALSVVEGVSNGYMEGGPSYVALEYVRNRVGVPRDLLLPSARQLRAHLTWMMESIVA